jgi:hypothetical protein
MTTAALDLRKLLPEPELPAGARRVRSSVPITVEVNDPRARQQSPNGEDYDVKIVASTKRVARDGGIIPVESWARDLSRYLANPVVQWAHSYREPPVATCVHIELEPGQGQLVEYWRFLDGITEDQWDQFCGRLKALYAVRGLRAASVGFIVHEWRDPTDQEKIDALQKGDAEPRWVAVRAELLETSAVPVPADPFALSVDRALEEAEAKQIDVAIVRARWNSAKQVQAPPLAAETTRETPAAAANPSPTPTIAPTSNNANASPENPTPQPAASARVSEQSAPATPAAPTVETPAAQPAAASRGSSAELARLPEDRLRALVREEFAAAARGDSMPARRAGLLALDDVTLRRIAREELDRVFVRTFGFPARTPTQRTS